MVEQDTVAEQEDTTSRSRPSPTSPPVERIRRGVIGEGTALDGPYGRRRITYTDHTASGRSLTFIEDFIRDAVLPGYANTHTESSGTALLHEHGALSFWDYAAAGPYVPIRTRASAPGRHDHKDAIFLSPPKFVGGPQAPGMLVVRGELVGNAVPTMPGGGTAAFVDCSCAGPYGHRLLAIDPGHFRAYRHQIGPGREGIKPGRVRVNVNYFISDTVRDYLVDAVDLLARHGYRPLPVAGGLRGTALVPPAATVSRREPHVTRPRAADEARTIVGVLPVMRSTLAVVAHPDDESFGLGAVIDAMVRAGGRVAVLCFTRGEASTIGGVRSDLAAIRSAEFAAAAGILGVARTEPLDYRDGRLSATPPAELAGHVVRLARGVAADHLLVFDVGGVTGHPDHEAATAAARTATERLHLPVLGWTLPETAATRLNAELGTRFVGRAHADIDWILRVDRSV